MQFFNQRGEAGGRYLFVFNDQGLLTHFDFYRKDGTLGSSQVLNYNDKGFQSEYTSSDKDKNVIGKTYSTYEYDQRGNWIKATIRDDKGFTVISERVYTYFE